MRSLYRSPSECQTVALDQDTAGGRSHERASAFSLALFPHQAGVLLTRCARHFNSERPGPLRSTAGHSPHAAGPAFGLQAPGRRPGFRANKGTRPDPTDKQPTDAAYPRYFVRRNGLKDDPVYLRVDKPDGALIGVYRGGCERCHWPVMAFAHPGDWREITARDADTLLAKANVRRATESTGERRSKA